MGRLLMYKEEGGLKSKKEIEETLKLLTPKEIVDKLNKHVIGQDEAKKVLSVLKYLFFSTWDWKLIQK